MIQIAVKSTGQNDFGPYNNFAEVGGGRALELTAPDALNNNLIFLKK